MRGQSLQSRRLRISSCTPALAEVYLLGWSIQPFPPAEVAPTFWGSSLPFQASQSRRVNSASRKAMCGGAGGGLTGGSAAGSTPGRIATGSIESGKARTCVPPSSTRPILADRALAGPSLTRRGARVSILLPTAAFFDPGRAERSHDRPEVPVHRSLSEGDSGRLGRPDDGDDVRDVSQVRGTGRALRVHRPDLQEHDYVQRSGPGAQRRAEKHLR